MSRRLRRSPSGILTIVNDPFTRADGDTNTLGTAPTGQVWTSFGGARWTISGNQAVPFQAGAITNGMVINAGRSDYTLQLTQIAAASLTGVVFRWVDASNYWLWYYFSATTLKLSKFVAGVETSLGTNLTGGSNAGDVYSISCTPSNVITTKLNGGVIRTVTDAANSGGTWGGFGGTVGTSDFYDNFSIVTP